jgi:hypothetical protein
MRDEDFNRHRVRARRWVRRATGVFVFFFILHPSSFILSKQPALFEPGEHYYKAEGFSVRVKWEVPVTKVEEGRDLSATLVVTGATNPTKVVKPDLKKLRAFDHFTVTDVPEAARTESDKEIRFAYKLRPRNRSVTQVPALEFKFRSLAAPPGKNPFRLTRAESVDITVTEPPPKPITPMFEADRLFEIATGPGVLRVPFTPCRWAWGAAALFGPLAALAWYLAWRRVYPDAAKLARLRRSRADRRATEAIRRSGRSADPPAAIAAAVLGYLRAHFPLPESAVTPSEIAEALTEVGVPEVAAEQTADVFRACDRARFAPPGDRGASLAHDAETAITRLEALA